MDNIEWKNDPETSSKLLLRALQGVNEIMSGKTDIHPTKDMKWANDEISLTVAGNKPAALMIVGRGFDSELQKQNDAMRLKAKERGLVEVIRWKSPKVGEIVFVKPGNEYIANAILDPNTSNFNRGLLLGYGMHSKEQ